MTKKPIDQEINKFLLLEIGPILEKYENPEIILTLVYVLIQLCEAQPYPELAKSYIALNIQHGKTL